MSAYYRVQCYREKLFLKSLRLKRCKTELQKVLVDNFSDKDCLVYMNFHGKINVA